MLNLCCWWTILLFLQSKDSMQQQQTYWRTPGRWVPVYLHASSCSWTSSVPRHCAFSVLFQQLNWTSKPFPGDVQVNWRYTFPTGDPPPGLMSKLLVVCMNALETNYHYHWRHGVLIKNGEVQIFLSSLLSEDWHFVLGHLYTSVNFFTFQATVCIQKEKNHFDLCCRVNGEINSAGDHNISMEFLWVTLAVYIKESLEFLSQWPGLLVKVCCTRITQNENFILQNWEHRTAILDWPTFRWSWFPWDCLCSKETLWTRNTHSASSNASATWRRNRTSPLRTPVWSGF